MATHIKIDDTTPIITYDVAASTAGPFTVPFAFFTEKDLEVRVDDVLKTLTTHYTVAGEGLSEGGSITFVTAIANVTLEIKRWIPIERITDFANSGPLPIDGINTELDRQIAIDQQIYANIGSLNEEMDRALKVPPGETINDLPPRAIRATKALGFDADGEPIVSQRTLAQIDAGVNIITSPGFIIGSSTLDVPSVYPTVGDALAYLSDKALDSDSTHTIRVTGVVSISSGNIADLDHYAGRNIRLTGASVPLQRTIQPSGHSVSGGAGNHAVTIKLDTVDDIEPGHVLALGRYPGVPPMVAGTMRFGATCENDLFWGLDLGGKGAVGRMWTVGTAVTFDEAADAAAQGTALWGGVLPMIMYRGEVRAVTAIGGDGWTCTLESAFSEDVGSAATTTGVAYWYWVPQAPGTISTVGGPGCNVSGAGTDFLARAAPRSILFAKDCITGVQSISGDTQMVVHRSPQLPAGSKYGIMAHPSLFRGAFEINAVDAVNNTVTVINRFHTAASFLTLDPHALTGGHARIHTNVLKNTATLGKGIVNSRAIAFIDNLAFVGSGGTSSIGIEYDDAGGVGGQSVAEMKLGENVALTEWGNGIRMHHGSLYANYVVIGNNRGAYCIFNRQGRIYIRNATIGQGQNFGIWAGEGSSNYASTTTIVGCGGWGLSRLGAAWHADGLRTYGCGGGVVTEGSSSVPTYGGRTATTGAICHDVENWDVCPHDEGTAYSGGCGGRLDGNLVLAGTANGITVTNSQMSGVYAIVAGVVGATSYAVSTSQTDFDWESGAAVCNSNGLIAGAMSRVLAKSARALHNGGAGIKAQTGSRINAEDVLADGNTVDDYAIVTVAGYGTVLVANDSVNPTPNYSHSVNTVHSGAIIITEAYTDPVADPESLIAHGVITHDFPTIPPHGALTHTFAVPGAADLDEVNIRTSGSAPLNVIFRGLVTDTDEVTVVANNIGSGPINLGSTTFGYSVKRQP